MISSSRLAELQHVPPAWKFCAVQPRAFRSRKCSESRPPPVETTARPQKHCPGHEKNKRGGAEPGPPARTERKRKCSEAPFMGLRGSWASATPGGCPPAWLRRRGPRPRARVVVLEGHERAHQSELVFEQQNRFRNSRERQRIEKKAFRARADAAQSARQEEPSPGPPASETDAGPPGHQPRGGAPARPRLSRGQEGPT